MPEYEYAYGKHDHHKGIFFVATILTVGLCSMFPAMCFKNLSGKEKAARRKAEAVAKDARRKQKHAEGKRQDAEEVLEDMEDMMVPRMASNRLQSPTTAHVPHRRHHHHHRHHSSRSRDRYRDRRDDRARSRRYRDEDEESERTGPREAAASQWQSSAKALPPQLVGRGAGANAHVLGHDSHDYALFVSEAAQHDANLSEAAMPSPTLLSPTWNTRDESSPSSESNHDQLPQPTPGSSSSRTTRSSRRSYASSFPALLHSHRNDNRLLKRKSKPSQHLGRRPPLVHQPHVPARSSSYYKPRVVEDSAVAIPPTPLSPSPKTMLPLSPQSPSPLPSVHSLSPLRKSRSSPEQSDSGSSRAALGPLRTPFPQPISTPFSDKSTPMSPMSPLSLPCSFHSEASEDSNSRQISRRQLLPNPLLFTSSSGSPKMVFERRWEPQTPPEAEPRPYPDTPSGPRRHYFRTFSNDLMKISDTASRSPDASYSTNDSEEPRLQPSTQPDVGDGHLEAVSPNKKKRKRSGMLGGVRSSHSAHSPLSTSNSNGSTPSTRSRATPDIRISSPGLANSRRKASVSSYFSRVRRSQNVSAELTPGSAASPALSTHWEEVLAEGQDPAHVKELSEPMSPLSVPAKRFKPPLRRSGAALDVPEATRRLPDPAIMPAIPSGAAVRPQPKYKSADGREYYRTSLKGPDAVVNFLPSEMMRIDTPPLLKKKPTGFKGFFFDMRNMPSSEAESESPGAVGTKRRSPIVSKMSLQSLVPKFSIPKLKTRSSCLIPEPCKLQPPDDPLRVTSFQQTPYSQRYSDAQRAKRNQARAHMDEALRDEDNTADSAMGLPFELNVPDHLPGSPLCPLSPKHKSGGKAICPMHGRKKAVKTGLRESVKGEPVKERQGAPTIVFESSQRDRTPGVERED